MKEEKKSLERQAKEEIEQDSFIEEKKSVLTLPMVAKYLNLEKEKVRDMARKREIPSAKVGKKWLFPKWKVNEWLEKLSEKMEEAGEEEEDE